MRVVLKKSSLRVLLTCVQTGLLGCGALMLGYCGLVLADTWMFQHRAERFLSQAAMHPTTRPTPIQAPDGIIGRMEIPRLGVSVIVTEGTDESALRRAAGHIEGTALPWQSRQYWNRGASRYFLPACGTFAATTSLP